jgi:hypothetical protein
VASDVTIRLTGIATGGCVGISTGGAGSRVTRARVAVAGTIIAALAIIAGTAAVIGSTTTATSVALAVLTTTATAIAINATAISVITTTTTALTAFVAATATTTLLAVLTAVATVVTVVASATTAATTIAAIITAIVATVVATVLTAVATLTATVRIIATIATTTVATAAAVTTTTTVIKAATSTTTAGVYINQHRHDGEEIRNNNVPRLGGPKYLPGVGVRGRTRRAFSMLRVRPSMTSPRRPSMAASAISEVTILTKPKPRDSPECGSFMIWHFSTSPYFSKRRVISDSSRRGWMPVTKRFEPGL